MYRRRRYDGIGAMLLCETMSENSLHGIEGAEQDYKGLQRCRDSTRRVRYL